MAFAMDTLSYAKRLREAGIPPEQAEAHAEAAREYIMVELVTKQDLETAVSFLRQDMGSMRREFEAAIDRQTLRLTVRLGGMLAFAIAALATLMKL